MKAADQQVCSPLLIDDSAGDFWQCRFMEDLIKRKQRRKSKE